MAAAHHRMRQLLPPPDQPRHTSFIFIKDSVAATDWLTQDLPDRMEIVEGLQASLDEMVAAVGKLPAADVAHVLSPTLARSLKLDSKEMKKKVALEVAWAVFPQSRARLR